MKTRVVKFGGSNLQSTADLQSILNVIKAYNCPLIIVVSALFGITDMLYQGLNRSKHEKRIIRDIPETLFVRHDRILKTYIRNSEKLESARDRIRERLDELGKYLLGIHCLGDIPDFARDRVVCCGERLASSLLCSVLNDRGIVCQEKMPESIGIVTDGVFGNANIDLPETQKRIRHAFNDKTTFIVPGFYGISQTERITTLGRGGSDYSAAAIASCLGAESLDLWKDVPGFLSADPKHVAQPYAIEHLSYREAAELSYFGAKILHPGIFEPLMEHNIPVRIFNIRGFKDRLCASTLINHNGIIKEDIIKSVTSSDDVGVLKLQGPRVGIKPGILAEVTACLGAANINIRSVMTSQTVINILLSREDAQRGYGMVLRLGLQPVQHVSIDDEIALVAVVGEGMLEKPGIAARVFGAVSKQGVNVQIICSGASVVAAYFIIASKDREKVIQVVHKEFFS